MKKMVFVLVMVAVVLFAGCDEVDAYGDAAYYNEVGTHELIDETMPDYTQTIEYETSLYGYREPIDIRLIAVDREEGLIVYHVEKFFSEHTMMLCATPGGLAPTWYFPYSGVRFDTSSLGNIAVSFLYIDYRLAENKSAVHLNGIDGTSTRDDVVALFGEPVSIMLDGFLPSNRYSFDINNDFEFDIYDFPVRLSPSKYSVRYGYRLDDNISAGFHFDDNDNVITISLTGWQSPFTEIGPIGQG